MIFFPRIVEMKELIKRQQSHYRHSLIQPPDKSLWSRASGVSLQVFIVATQRCEILSPMFQSELQTKLMSHELSFSGVSLRMQNQESEGTSYF